MSLVKTAWKEQEKRKKEKNTKKRQHCYFALLSFSSLFTEFRVRAKMFLTFKQKQIYLHCFQSSTDTTCYVSFTAESGDAQILCLWLFSTEPDEGIVLLWLYLLHYFYIEIN